MLKGIEIFKAIAELEPGRVNQNHGTYTREKPCCVGAHLAHQLDVSWEKDPDAYPRHLNDYFRGADEWAKKMGVTRAHVIIMLRNAGAGQNPLSGKNWKYSPTEVYKNLLEIEEFPTLVGVNLSKENLVNADLQGVDFTDANLISTSLRRTNLKYANFTNAKLLKADFEGANLWKANLTNADLRGAKTWYTSFTNANLQGADFTHTTLMYPSFRNANLKDTNFTHTTLMYPSFRNANLKDTNFTNATLIKPELEGANLQDANLKDACLPPNMETSTC